MNQKNEDRNRNLIRGDRESAKGKHFDNGETAAIQADAHEECEDTKRRRKCEFSEPVCINTNQIYDSCRDRDCVVNQRVYLTGKDQELVECAINVKLKSAEIIWVFTDIEPLSFAKGYFTVDLKFFVLATLEVFTGVSNPTIIRGLTTYDKRIALFGSEGNTKVFNSKHNSPEKDSICKTWRKKSMPTVTVEVADPVALTAAFDDDCCDDCCDCSCKCDLSDSMYVNMCNIFDNELVVSDDVRRVVVTYGLFFIVRLERETQLLVDAVDFCIPNHECPAATENNPCLLFNDIRFPIDEFFPPKKANDDNYENSCGCNNSCR